MPTTEVAILPLVAGSKIGDPNDTSSKVVQGCLNTLNQQDGFQQVHFGTWVESENNLQLLINWDSKAKHEEFMQSAAYQPFLNSLGSIMDGAPNLTHVDFKPDGGLEKALSAPVTEIATLYFEEQLGAEYDKDMEKFHEIVSKDAAGFLGAASGWSHEEIEHEKLGDKKGKTYSLVVGWQDVKAHMDFRETQTFKDNIKLFRNNAKGVEMHHVAMLPFAG